MYLFYLILILLSFSGIFFVLVLKTVEIKSGKSTFFGRLSVSVDPTLRRTFEKIVVFLSHFNVVAVKSVITTVAQKIFHVSGTAGLFISKHHKRLTSRLNGKRNLESKGSVSFFLKDVAESKEEKRDL